MCLPLKQWENGFETFCVPFDTRRFYGCCEKYKKRYAFLREGIRGSSTGKSHSWGKLVLDIYGKGIIIVTLLQNVRCRLLGFTAHLLAKGE